jgi:hypothetical protein
VCGSGGASTFVSCSSERNITLMPPRMNGCAGSLAMLSSRYAISSNKASWSSRSTAATTGTSRRSVGCSGATSL